MPWKEVICEKVKFDLFKDINDEKVDNSSLIKLKFEVSKFDT